MNFFINSAYFSKCVPFDVFTFWNHRNLDLLVNVYCISYKIEKKLVESTYNQENSKRFIIAMKQKLQTWDSRFISISVIFRNYAFRERYIKWFVSGQFSKHHFLIDRVTCGLWGSKQTRSSQQRRVFRICKQCYKYNSGSKLKNS